MANQDRRPVAAASRQAGGSMTRTSVGGGAAAGVTEVRLPGSPGGTVIGGDDGAAQVYDSASRAFGAIADKVGRWADHAATREGKEDGALAGLDPEFRPRADGTLYSEAYNGTGIDTFKQRAITSLAVEMDATADKHKADPAGLKGALAKLRSGTLDALDPSLRPHVLPDMEAMFARRSVGYVRDATRAHQAQVRAQQQAAMFDSVSERMTALQQQAYRLGLDVTADTALAGEVADLKRQLGARGPDGKPLFAPLAAAKMLQNAEKEVANARILGAFDRLQSLTGKKAFIDSVEQDFAKGQGVAKVYDLSDYQAIRARLDTQLRRDEMEQRRQQVTLHGEVAAVQKMAAKGFRPTPEAVAKLRTKIAETGDAVASAGLDQAEADLKVQGYLMSSSRLALRGLIDGERARMQKEGTTPQGVARLEMAENILSEMNATLKRDPWEWAARAGIAPQPIGWGGPSMVADLRKRAADATAVSERYGIPPPYFTAEDRQAIGQVVREGGGRMIQVAGAIVDAYGDKADEAFAELGKFKGGSARTLALFGGLVKDKASVGIIQDVSAGLALRATPDFKPQAGAAKDTLPILRSATVGSALRALGPKVGDTIRSMADAAYEVRARRKQLTAFDSATYTEVVNEVLGAVDVGGVQYGGVGWQRHGLWGSSAVIVPAGVRADRFGDVIGLINEADLQATGQQGYDVKGKPLPVSALRRGTFVSVGAGRYWIGLGSDLDADPQWVMTADGKRQVFDLGALVPRLKKRNGAYFLEGD